MTAPSGFRHLAGYFSPSQQAALLAELRAVIAAAPLFVPRMPRSGKPFSVRMSNCGTLGWVSDKDGGYRYQAAHPETGRPWPVMPQRLLNLWNALANYGYDPEACLINYYSAGTKMGSHRDADEADFKAPVLSVSLGDDAVFHVGGRERSDAKQRLLVKSGDVVVLGGEARLAYHGIDRVLPGTSSLLAEGGRLNLTLRRVGPVASHPAHCAAR
jgi:alkylated DNA repair protein (DNA oxidative demethylase)